MTVHLEFQAAVAVVTIDRPHRRNALDHQTLIDLLEMQTQVRATPTRCLVLTGATPAFCAGADLSGVESGEFLQLLAQVLHGLATMAIPTIAAIDGPALGAGTQLAISCDLRIATADSVCGIPAAKLGLAVDQWTIDRLGREFGVGIARAMLLAAQTFTAAELFTMGAIQRLGDLQTAMQWAAHISELAPLTIAAHKLGLAGDDRFETQRQAVWDSADAEEGRIAFLEKRQPRFRGE